MSTNNQHYRHSDWSWLAPFAMIMIGGFAIIDTNRGPVKSVLYMVFFLIASAIWFMDQREWEKQDK